MSAAAALAPPAQPAPSTCAAYARLDTLLNGPPADDSDLRRLHITRAYLQLGLASAARGLVNAFPTALRQSAEFASLSAALARSRPSHVPWSACAGRFRRNLAALAARDTQITSIAAAWSSEHERFELHRAGDGNYQVLERTEAGMRWLAGLRPHRQEAERRALAHDPAALIPSPYLFDGLGLGWCFRRAYDATRNTFLGYACALYVVEPDPLALALVLHLHDWSGILADPRVYCCVGPAAAERFEALLRDDPDLMLPGVCANARLRPELGESGAAAAVTRVDAGRGQREAESLAQVRRQYAGRDAVYWAARFRAALDGAAAPLRILSFVSRHTSFLQYSMRDARQAFESLGCVHRVISEPSDHHGFSAARYHAELADFDPDLFFLLDHFRRGHESRLPENLPMFTWDQDGLPDALNRAGMASVGPLDVVAGMTKQTACLRLGLPAHKYLTTVVPTNPNEYNAEPIRAADLAPHRCDISYVSNQSQPPRAYHEEGTRRIAEPSGRRLVEYLYAALVQRMSAGELVFGPRAIALLAQAEEQTGVFIRNPQARDWFLTWYLWRLADRIFRHQALEWTADWCDRNQRRFHLYGRGWEQHPRLAPYARGVAANGAELRAIYQASAINLQIFPGGFIHQRAMDGLAAGGFFLTRRSPADAHGILVRAIGQRCDALGIATTSQMLNSDDAVLRQALDAFRAATGDPLTDDGPVAVDKLAELRIQSEIPCAADHFPRFDEIAFDSPTTFAAAAERFIDDAPSRAALAAAMRQSVLAQFTYETTVRRLLRFMADYLEAESASQRA